MQGKPTEAEWAWLAGLFEGEGSFNFNSKRSVVVRIGMTDRDVVESVDRLVPSPNGLLVIDRAPHKTMYLWLLSSKDDVIAFIQGVLPWLHGRRSQRAQECLARLATNRGWHSGKPHCRHGHLWAEAGIYVAPNGKRHCRGCIRESGIRYRAKNLEADRLRRKLAERERRKRKRILRESAKPPR